jgi:tRNA-specific 2-thiouridylase
VGPRAALDVHELRLAGVNWLGGARSGAGAADGMEIQVKLRSTQPPAPASLHLGGDGGARVALHAPQPGIAPGQACVFYDGDRVLGGGWIQRQPAPVAA